MAKEKQFTAKNKVITIRKASAADFPTITKIAFETWPSTYGKILSNKQINYMLDLFYSTKGLQNNLDDGHAFLIAENNNVALGFASYICNYPEIGVTKIPKIYLLPESQGLGIGKMLINTISDIAIQNSSTQLTLNVNKYNSALGFYQKLGFTISAEIDIELDHGYLMEDYILVKPL